MDWFRQRGSEIKGLKKRFLSSTFKDYSGANDYDSALDFITKKFLDENKKNRSIQVKVTQANIVENSSKLVEELCSISTKNSIVYAPWRNRSLHQSF